MLRQLLDRLVPNAFGARPPAACLDCRSGIHEGCTGWCACEVAGHGTKAAAERGTEVARERT
ncbi:MAG TPA: hypothetical protein VF825_09600 [Oryzihumus sp.]